MFIEVIKVEVEVVEGRVVVLGGLLMPYGLGPFVIMIGFAQMTTYLFDLSAAI